MKKFLDLSSPWRRESRFCHSRLSGIFLSFLMLASFGCATAPVPDKVVSIDDQIGIADKAQEVIPYRVIWTISKFKDLDDVISKQLQAGASIEPLKPYEVVSWEGNIALREGITELLGLIAAIGSPTAWSNAAAYLGTGTSTSSEAATQTGLIAGAVYKAMDSTYPQIVSVGTGSNNALEWRSTFGTGDANQAWEEFSVSNTSLDTGKNLNRKTSSKGTKVSGETWTLSMKICFGTECT